MTPEEALSLSLEALRKEKACLEGITGGYSDRRPRINRLGEAIDTIELMLRERHDAYQ